MSAERYVHSDLPLLGAMVEHMFLSKLSDSEHDELFIIKRTPEAPLLASDHPALYAALQANPVSQEISSARQETNHFSHEPYHLIHPLSMISQRAVISFGRYRHSRRSLRKSLSSICLLQR